MAVIRQPAAPRRFLGNSQDTKPTDDGIPAGSEFRELDTGRVYRYDGTSWTADPFQVPDPNLYPGIKDLIDMQQRMLRAMWNELRAIRNNTALAVGKPDLPEDTAPAETQAI